MDDVTWGALTLTLTVLGGLWTWVAFRRRGAASGLRALALTLLPLAAYLTRTLRMFTRIVDAVGDWASALVLDPRVWTGIGLAGLSVVLFVVSGAMRARQLGTRADRPARGSATGSRPAPDELPRADGAAGRGRPAMGADDDLADIEAILKRRGIS